MYPLLFIYIHWPSLVSLLDLGVDGKNRGMYGHQSSKETRGFNLLFTIVYHSLSSSFHLFLLFLFLFYLDQQKEAAAEEANNPQGIKLHH